MSFIRRGISNVLIYGCGLMIVNGLSFAMLPFYTREFAPAQYAIIALMITLLPFSRYIFSLEICQAAPIYSSDDTVNAWKYISTGFWFTLIVNLVIYAVLISINTVIRFYTLDITSYIMLACVLITDALYYYTSNIQRWQLKHYTYNTIISCVALLEAALTIYFVWRLKLGITGVFAAWFIARIIGAVANYIFTRKFYRLTIDSIALLKMLKFSLPLAFSNIPYNINRVFDRWIIASFLGMTTLGIYSAGATVGGIVSFVMASLSTSLTPYIYKNHLDQNAPHNILKLFYAVIAVCLWIVIVFSLFNHEILRVFVAKNYLNHLDQNPIVQIIVLSSVLSGITIFAPGLSVMKKTHHVIWMNIISLLANIIIVSVLLHYYGILGVAMGTLGSVIINTGIYMYVSNQYYRIPHNRVDLCLLLITYSVLYLSSINLGMYPFHSYQDGLLYRFIFLVINTAVISLLLMKMISNVDQRKQDFMEERLQLINEYQ